MRNSLLHYGFCIALAALCGTTCADIARAVDATVDANAYAPQLMQPANRSSIRVAQINPPPPGTPAQSAQPGQSTIPPATSTPFRTGLPDTTGEAASAAGQPAQGEMQAQPSTAMPGPAIAVPAPVIPPQQVVVPGGVTPPQTQVITPPAGTQPTPADPFTDGAYVEEEELPLEAEVARARGVRPYGGGHPWDWYWGCGGSPYRTKGACDDWKVGPDWAISINGMVMSREDADLDAINAAIVPNGLTPLDDPTFENFDFGPGARITFMSQVPYYVGYQVQAAYEGIEAWESSIVYEKQPLPDIVVPLPPNPPYVDPFPEGFEQRRLHYRSNYHSGELNWLPGGKSVFKPLFGVRYINLDDEINDFNDQEAQPPLPGPGDLIDVDPGAAEELVFKPIGPVTTTDRLNLFDIQNNLIGFQIGLMYDTWKINRRLSLEGFVNSGVYYNKVKYNNTMGIFTTQVFADNTNTTDFDEARIDFSDAVNVDAREYDEISYTAEASLSGILRLNKCWALRGGYQVLWIGNVQLAEDAYLGNENETDNLIFHGWHFGIECRR